MYKLVISSKSEFSNAFRDDITEMITKLRVNGKLELQNNKIQLKTDVPKRKNDNDIITVIDTDITDRKHIYNYTNPQIIRLVCDLIHNGKNLGVSRYIREHVLYMFVITLNMGTDYVYCKIGYSANISDRIKELRSEYKASFFLIGIKCIKDQQEEIAFHSHLQAFYPEYHVQLEINGKKKDEIYFLCDTILHEFNIHSEEQLRNTKHDIDKDLTTILNIQYDDYYRYLIDCVNKNNQRLLQATNLFQRVFKTFDKNY